MYQETQSWYFLGEISQNGEKNFCTVPCAALPPKVFMKVALAEIGLTSLPQMFPSLRFCERGHLIELGVNAGMLEAPEMDALAVNDTI